MSRPPGISLKTSLWLTLLLAIVAALLVWQQTALRGLKSENSELRGKAAELEGLRAENTRLAQAQADPAEIQRLRSAQSELLRLRGEVSQLRQQLKDKQLASAKPSAAARETPSTASEQPVSPVDTYTATTQASIGWQQTLVTGGWMMPSGKRAVVFVQPQTDNALSQPGQPAQLMIQTRIAELPEEVMSQLGLGGLKSENKKSSSQAILETDAILKALEQATGVDMLSAPRITTLDGRQAQVQVTEKRATISGETYDTGPLIDIVPRISADGASVDLSVSAQLRLPSTPAR